MGNLTTARSKDYPPKCIATTAHVVAAGGDASSSDNHVYILDVYNKDLIKVSTSARLSYEGEWLGGVAIDNWMIFCGGYLTGSTGGPVKPVNIFDENLVRTISELDYALYNLEGASVGDYGILAGQGNVLNTVIFKGV